MAAMVAAKVKRQRKEGQKGQSPNETNLIQRRTAVPPGYPNCLKSSDQVITRTYRVAQHKLDKVISLLWLDFF